MNKIVQIYVNFPFNPGMVTKNQSVLTFMEEMCPSLQLEQEKILPTYTWTSILYSLFKYFKGVY